MRIPRPYYDALKKIESNGGSTKEVTLDELDWLIAERMIENKDAPRPRYEFNLTPRGLAAISDRPITETDPTP